MKNHKYLPLKGMGKVHFYSLALNTDWHLLIKNAFRHREKLPYLFTIHYYLLLSKNSMHSKLVKSEKRKSKNSAHSHVRNFLRRVDKKDACDNYNKRLICSS